MDILDLAEILEFSDLVEYDAAMARLDDHYLRVRDYAERFNLSESAVYKKIERGEIEAIRIGKTVRIPSSEMERYINPVRLLEEEGPPRDGEPHNLEDRVARFEEATGRSPAEYVQAWRSGEIEDTAENAQLAIEALALRAALEQPSLAATD
jgi:excisionase family DNA binding protein